MNSARLPNSIVFNLEQIGLPDPKVESFKKKAPHDWLKSIFKAKNDSKKFDIGNMFGYRKTQNIIESINESSIKNLHGSIISENIDFTHEGLIQYIFQCWAHEYGAVLTPDMFFYTILSEIKNLIVGEPDTFRSLFTSSNKKIQVTVVDLTIDSLMSVLETLIPSKDLFNIITKTTFESAPDHFPYVLGITMADMGTPYYSYCSTLCGIPKVMVFANRDEWMKLIDTINIILNIFTPLSHNLLNSYLNKVIEILNQIVTACDKNNVEFFKNMFSYEKNKYCGSGHTETIINGWITNFYIETFSYIGQYSSHMNCLPYCDKDDPNNIKYYFYVCGLSSSKLENGFLFPQYDIAHCQITHPDSKIIFDTIACDYIK